MCVCVESSHSPLAAYQGGPLLAVYQPDEGETSCDACFLWKLDAFNPLPFLNMEREDVDKSETCYKNLVTYVGHCCFVMKLKLGIMLVCE